LIGIADRLRDDAQHALQMLRRTGLDVRMLTGDRTETALVIARSLGLAADETVAEATPESKKAFVEAEGANAIMVGDGINDAAALAAAGVGVALASGTQIAIESADVVIPGERVRAVPEFIVLARATMRTIRQNLFLAFFYNVIAIPVAALGLLGHSGPLWAALAMGLSDASVVGNALRLKYRLEQAGGAEPTRPKE
jgi:Cu+-exporting ATPase